MGLSQRKLTVPNVITLLRGLAIPWVFSLVWRDPAGNWWIAAAFALTDNLDGILARIGDKNHRMRKLGFHRSESGRRLDPIVDKLFVAAIVAAGLLHGAIPAWLGIFWLMQKTVLIAVILAAVLRQKKLAVSRTGKYGEFVTNCGLLGLLAVQGISGSELRYSLEYIVLIMSLTGIGIATVATYDYAKRTGLIDGAAASS